MSWERIDDLEALRIAIQTEIDSYKYYRSALKVYPDKDAQALLNTLADVGKRHLRRLEEKYARLSGKRLLYINLPKKRRLTKPLDPQASVLQILEAAIEQERNSKDFYEKAALRTLDLRGRRMLEELAEEEKEQMDILQAEYKVRVKNVPSASLKIAKV